MSKFKLSLTNNQLKIIAMISMVLDHIGLVFFPKVVLFRFLGRISFPIYAYMIAEGCAHTKNRKRYLGMILGMGILFQIVYLIFMKDIYQGILITFSLSIGIIYAIEGFAKSNNVLYRTLMIFIIALIIFFGIVCPILFEDQGFAIDYDAWGILLPVFIYFAPTKFLKLVCCAIVLATMACFSLPRQWFALITIPLLALYNGERGKLKMKYFFYIFYPLHLVIIYGIMYMLYYLNQ